MKSFDSLKVYAKVARPDHWFKNAFMLVGMILAISENHIPIDPPLLLKIGIALSLTCLLSSANYVINEIYDAQFDRKHPNKKFRSVAAGRVSVRKLVWLDFFLVVVALSGSYVLIGNQFTLIMALFFVIGGIFYNIPPFRTKDLPWIDILGESVNNPIRLLLGWYAIVATNGLPFAAILGYWAFGASLVTAKRLAEFRHFGPGLIGYRPTFRHYSNTSLIFFYFFFCILCLACLVFLGMTYQSRLYFTVPILTGFLIWFSVLTFQENSIVKEPERIFEKKLFAVYCFLSLLLFALILL